MTSILPTGTLQLIALEMTASALLFDMDGTLINSDASMTRAYTALARRYAMDPAHVLTVGRGRRAIDTINAIAPKDTDIRADLAFVEQMELNDLAGVTEIPGASRLLHSLPSQRWAVVTSASRELACRRLTAASLPLPEVMVTAEDVAIGKPDPAGYLLAAQRLGVEARRCIVFEDAIAGVAAGRTAGAQVIALTTATTADEFSNTHCIRDMRAVEVTVSNDELKIRIRDIAQ
jgi:sugar-phosphatase